MSVRGTGSVFDAPLCTALTEQSFQSTLSDAEFDGLWAYAADHSVDLLLAAVLRRDPDLPANIREEASRRLGAAKLVEQLRHRELRRLLAAFHPTEVLLLKGAALAHTIYPEPHLRPRLDMDLFVRSEHVSHLHRSLIDCGYTREPAAALADFERSYNRVDDSGFPHYVDLHWGVANPAPFANALPFDAAWRASIPVGALGPMARTLGHADALLLACLHRVAHHHDSPSLLWLWDIHLLATRLTDSGWATLVRSAQQADLRAVTSRGLELAREKFVTRIPPDVLDQLKPSGRPEATARFLRGLRLAEIAMTDLAAMSWRARLAFLLNNLFPPRTHMQTAYPGWPPSLLPLAYLHRIGRGTRKWFRRPASAGMDAPPRHTERP